ncbi:exodeoxyribonuclease VII large subunit [Sulfurospirillum sp. hDNRA2]|uniref:exodeoxyribonuclease VII large subunit n=1 Tax=Sulfurospirillum sp. hDNRA2 TaxID=3237298 RepID=UPI0020B80FEB|nr:exodeoxyribonuclease VII large subunit [Sulfurospirillum sp. DNRA8]MCP3652244.1 exodeoxyribonuclease VII large subunit [Sulfurospirillum sp. DNRA8]MCR1811094.1 exodeoxyribonuclease VII large subunit [Sulfurospirillum sp. DNRA8]
MSQTQSVSSLNNQIKSLLEATFLHVSVEGEISRATYHSSGHLYFTLKDADSAIACVMFKGNAKALKFQLEEGMAVIVHGALSVFSPRGTYQINCLSMEPAGSGALAKAYEQLKAKLSAKGYFDAERKKRLPKFVERVALVTSATGAALQDMLKVAQKRWPLVNITLLDTLVQGENAKLSIAENIAKADRLNVDVIIIARGGGSIEDLWAFNEEIVADAIFTCQTPIVSAVGHEIDYVISDFVADVRAPTPSAAMEMLLPDQIEMLQRLDDTAQHYERLVERLVHTKVLALTRLQELFHQHSIDRKMALWKSEIALLQGQLNERFERLLREKAYARQGLLERLVFQTRQNLSTHEQLLVTYRNAFSAKEPKREQKECYAQIVRKGKKVALETIEIDEVFELQTPSTILLAQALSKRPLDL